MASAVCIKKYGEVWKAQPQMVNLQLINDFHNILVTLFPIFHLE